MKIPECRSNAFIIGFPMVLIHSNPLYDMIEQFLRLHEINVPHLIVVNHFVSVRR